MKMEALNFCVCLKLFDDMACGVSQTPNKKEKRVRKLL